MNIATKGANAMTSIVGSWNIRIPTELNATELTFNADGTFTDRLGN